MNISTPDEAARALKRSGTIIFPTETLYGLGCLATDEGALQRLFEIKGRAPDKPPPVLVADEAQLRTLVSAISNTAQTLMQQYWPGALTLILPAREELSSLLLGQSLDKSTPTIGVRMTPHPIARALCIAAGAPLVATSANFSGATGPAAAPSTLAEIDPKLWALVDAVVDGGVLLGQSSTILDCTCVPPRVLRSGAIKLQRSNPHQHDTKFL